MRVRHGNIVTVPELPEMQALAERLDDFVSGHTLLSIDLLGFSSLRTYAPRAEDLSSQVLNGITRRGKYLVWTFGNGIRVVLHLSQAGRVDTERPAKKTRPRGAVARFTFSDEDDATDAPDATNGKDGQDGKNGKAGKVANRAVLVREHGTQRKASWWILAPGDEGPLEGLGPEPDTEAFAGLIRTSTSGRRLHSDLRDQHVVAGIGRGWGDDILHRARLSPFATLRSLDAAERERLISATRSVLEEALILERKRTGGLSEAKLGGRFAVHGKFGTPCPTPDCGESLRRVSFESYEMTYCANCQTGGKVLADRRLSRLLK
jgi:formamidopyrimidine-DNA glycosylase